MLFAGQIDACGGAKAKLFGIADQPIRTQAHAQLHHAGINGKLDNRRKGHIAQALAIPVMNNAVGNANTASVIKNGVRRNNTFS